MRAAQLVGIGVIVLGGCGRMPAAPDATREPTPDVRIPLATEDFRLPNGLRVVLAPDRAAAAVVVHVRFHAGSKDDPPGRAGLAHLVEHLTYRSSPGATDVDFFTRLGEVGGGNANGSTDLDSTDYVTTVRPSLVGRALWLEAARMAQPLAALDDATLAAEREVVKNELRQRCDSDPSRWPRELARHAAFGDGHPYAHTPAGSNDAIDAIGIDDVRAFVSERYRPNNATLVLAGAFDADVVRPLLTPLFRYIPAGAVPPARTFPAVRAARSTRTEVRLAVARARLVFAWPVPATGAEGLRELDLACAPLHGMLVDVLVSRRRLASDVRVSLEPGGLGSLLTITVAPEADADMDAVASAVEDALAAVAAWGRVTEWPEYPIYQRRRIAARLVTLADVRGRAHELQDAVTYHDAPDAVRAELAALGAIRAGDVGSSVAQFLEGRPRYLIAVVPDPRAARPGSTRP
jgi:zinc protease